MNKIITTLILSLFGMMTFAQRHKCMTDEKLHLKLANNQAFKSRYVALEQEAVKRNLSNREQDINQPNIVFTIPVVVHVIYKTEAQNISDAQINSQIAILNNDFRKLNADFTSVVPSVFQPFGADLEIQFVLAKRTTTNQPTTGIVRTSVDASFDFDEKYYTFEGSPAWEPTQYLNIWVGRFTDTTLLGFTYGPANAGQPDDGVVIGDRFFGNTGSVVNPYNQGRTTTHEVGHYFNLRHPWGNGNGSTGTSCGVGNNSDMASDTPATSGPIEGCPNFPDNSKTCTSSANGAMFMNYMDYTNDACMAFFTAGQKTLVRAALDGARSSLKISQGGIALGLENFELANSIKIYPNPSYDIVSILSPNIVVDSAEIYNSLGQKVKVASNLSAINSFGVSDLSAGLYFLKLYSNKELVKTERLIKL